MASIGSRPGLRNDTSKRRGRSTILDPPLNADEQAARKKASYDKEQLNQKTSKSKSVSANRRWHPEWLEDEEVGIEKGNGDAALGMSSDARMVNAAVEIEGCHHGLGDLGDEDLREEQLDMESELMLDVEGRIDEVEVGEGMLEGVSSAAVLDVEYADKGTCPGSSERSKVRARDCLNTHLSKKNSLGQIDVLRKLGLMLIADGKELVGVELETRTASLASNLTKRQIFYAAHRILKETKKKKSLALWLPKLIKESLCNIKKELGL